MEDNKLVACGRYVLDPYNDSVEARKGVDLGSYIHSVYRDDAYIELLAIL